MTGHQQKRLTTAKHQWNPNTPLEKVLADAYNDASTRNYLTRFSQFLPAFLDNQPMGGASKRAAANSLSEFLSSRARPVDASAITKQCRINDPAGHDELLSKLTEIRDEQFQQLKQLGARALENKLAAEVAELNRILGPRDIEVVMLTLPKDLLLTMGWSVPKGVRTGSWKRSQKRLNAVVKKIEALQYSFLQVACDPLALSALMYVEAFRLDADEPSFHHLKTVISAAARLKANGGNRGLPEWAVEAAKLCRAYWRKNLGKPTSSFYPREKQREPTPENQFSEWFCAVMHALAGLSPSQCKTILERKRARVPEWERPRRNRRREQRPGFQPA